MLISIIALATNGYPDFERFALSLHTQEFESWRGHIVDINSTDHLEKLMWPLNKIRRCSLLRERFRYDILSGDTKFLEEGWKKIADAD